MMSINAIRVGDRVHYQPKHFGNKFENGIVKEISKDNKDEVRVVYSCDDDWGRYVDFTGVLTRLSDLQCGWR